jgi:cytochrome b involved in lipid metabolism
VYDISSYGEDHPGGLPQLLEVGDGDATEAFEDNGHSEHARELLQPFLIGELSAQVRARSS